jgi:outer membrane protein assembly factor BamE (lipoprotein component of BamABCDE complex)
MPTPVITRAFLPIAVLTVALAVSACEPHTAQRGAMPDVDVIASIQPQKSTRADVERALGSPSSVNLFGEETWMYIGEETEQLAFLERNINERSVLIIHFNKDGIVEDVESHGLEQSRAVEPVERTTPTVGKKLTVIEQLMGNLNRFGKAGKKN